MLGFFQISPGSLQARIPEINLKVKIIAPREREREDKKIPLGVQLIRII